MNMRRVKRLLVLFGTVGVLYWMYVYLQLPATTKVKLHEDSIGVVESMENRLNKVQSGMVKNRSVLNQLSESLQKLKEMGKRKDEEDIPPTPKQVIDSKEKLVIPVMVIAFNRPAVSRCLDLIFKYLPLGGDVELPVIVSQDGYDAATSKVIRGYGDKLHHLQHDNSDSSDVPQKQRNLAGYYKLSAHFKWAFNQVFSLYPSSSAVIVLEDDLDISPDFFSYFLSTHHVLANDESLLCVSAWNDNGKSGLIDEGKNGETLLYRTDFFPGLGWMITKKVWEELSPKWPVAFWDDWLRLPAQRKERGCIRPEVSRSMTFGKVGVSKGQFFEKHLKFIKLNKVDVDWSKIDVDYLTKGNYDSAFLNKVSNLPEISLSGLSEQPTGSEYRLTYPTLKQFKTLMKTMGLMEDLKSGVPRTAYKGVVPVFYKNVRVYIAPERGWKGYDLSWT